MKIFVHHKNLKKAIYYVEKVVAKNVSLPILNNILIKTENGRLKIAATNLEIGITCFIGAKIEEVGEIAVPGRIFSDLINNINEDGISLTTKNNTLIINTEKYKSNILGFEAKEYPIIPKIKSEPVCQIPSSILRSAFYSVADSIALSETRPELSGLLVKFSDKKIVFAATDSFRLVEKIIDNKQKNNQSVIVPRNTVMEMIRLCSEINDDVEIKIGDNQISFNGDDVEIISRLIDGNFPDYTKVIPDKFVSKMLVSKTELEKKIRLAGFFSSSISDIKINCLESKLVVSAKNTDKGEIQAEIDAVLKNEPFEVAINYNYLLDGLKIIETDKVVIEYTGQGSPLVLKPADDKKSLVYIIMPLRN